MSRKPTIPEVAPFIRMYYAMDGHGVGGSLHIVLDDGNVEDHSVSFCRTWALERQDYFGAALANILLRMSRSQRWRLYHGAWHRAGSDTEWSPYWNHPDGFWTDDGGWLWEEGDDPLPLSKDVYLLPFQVQGPIEVTYFHPRFAEPPAGTITRICGTCLRINVPLVWDEERWGYRCESDQACYEYLRSSREDRS